MRLSDIHVVSYLFAQQYTINQEVKINAFDRGTWFAVSYIYVLNEKLLTNSKKTTKAYTQ